VKPIRNSDEDWPVQRISLAAITIDPAVQQREAGTSQAIVADYAEAMRDGVAFPPIDVFRDEDGATYVANGFHRFDAHRSAHPGVEEIECRVRSGNRDDALLFACGANAQHGLRRSRSDKIKAVTTLLCSERWSGWSDREIARQCRVSHGFVAAVRQAYLDSRPDAGSREDAASASPDATDAPGVAPERRRSVKRSGRSYDMNTARIGKGRSTPPRRKKVAPKPNLNAAARKDARDDEQPLDEVARVEHAYDRFETTLRAASAPARKTFIEHRGAEIMGLARSINGGFAAASSAPATDSPADGGHDGH
jgi:hypothetical protein